MTGKPFTKNDPRINRNGRPKRADEFRGLILEKLHQQATGPDGEPLEGPDGEPITKIEQIIDAWIEDKRHHADLIQYAFGKPKPGKESLLGDWQD